MTGYGDSESPDGQQPWEPRESLGVRNGYEDLAKTGKGG